MPIIYKKSCNCGNVLECLDVNRNHDKPYGSHVVPRLVIRLVLMNFEKLSVEKLKPLTALYTFVPIPSGLHRCVDVPADSDDEEYRM